LNEPDRHRIAIEFTVAGLEESEWPAIRIALNNTLNLSVHIKIDDLNSPEIRELLEEHLASMRRHSPPESVHALPIEGLRKPEITFWTVWENGELLGCGALNEFVPFLWRDGAAPLAPQSSSRPNAERQTNLTEFEV
jgi:hypothetical protein